MEIIGGLTIIFILIVALTLYQSFSWGYVASVLYGWYIIPLDTNLPHLTWVHLAGVMFFVNCFVHSSTIHYLKNDIKDEKQGLLISLLAPWLTLFGAWIFKFIIL